MTARIKLKTQAPKTREEMETLVGAIANLKNMDRKLKSEMDAELKQIKDKYLLAFTGLNDQLTVLMPQALAWAETHAEDFGKAKSIDMLHGIIGWRTNTPSLKTLRGWTWDRVLEKLKTLGSYGEQFVRTKEEVDKQTLLANREALGPNGLKNLGCEVKQEEEFFVEPKLTASETREVA
jgi:phage host-nuclease inhibitor protein Gam